MDEGLRWLAAAISTAVLVAYELHLSRAARRDPTTTSRSAHMMLREEWVQALSRHPGTEVLAVQALRNSVMSATMNASTAALVLMGSISLVFSKHELARMDARPLTLSLVLELGLVLTLCAAFVCSAIAMRYYHHAGFAVSLPIGSPERTQRTGLAVAYVQRAGLMYSWSLRCFLFVLPIAVGLLNPFVMPISALVLVGMLALFDRPPKSHPSSSGM